MISLVNIYLIFFYLASYRKLLTHFVFFNLSSIERKVLKKVINLVFLFWCLSRVSKGVSGNFQSATSNIPSGKALMYFGLFLATGVFFVFTSFALFLPVIVLVPQKFAICFTLGCGFIIASFFALKGPKNQLAHMSSKERLPFTLGFIGSMVGTLYVSMVLHSYILSVLFSVIQVLALAYYAISYFPGGSTGLKFLSSSLTSSVMRRFGSWHWLPCPFFPCISFLFLGFLFC